MEQVRRLCKPRYLGDPPEPAPKPEREPDPEYYKGVTLKAQHSIERLILLELGCSYSDLRTMDYDEAMDLLATHTGRKMAEAQRMEEHQREAEQRSAGGTGSKLPARARTDPDFWNWDTTGWGGKPETTNGKSDGIWIARDTMGNPLDPTGTVTSPEWGLPPE